MAEVKMAILFSGRRLDCRYGHDGMKIGKSLSLREIADSTKRESAPPANTYKDTGRVEKVSGKRALDPYGLGLTDACLVTEQALCLKRQSAPFSVEKIFGRVYVSYDEDAKYEKATSKVPRK